MKTMLKRKPRGQTYILSLILILLIFLTAEARADLYHFYALTDNTGLSGDLLEQLSVVVTDSGNNTVTFKFINDNVGWGTIPGAITEIYFDDGSLVSSPTIIDWQGDVHFINEADPGDLPAGKTLIPKFDASVEFSVESDPENPINGVDPGEYVSIAFAANYSSVIEAILFGTMDPADYEGNWYEDSLRVGIHMRGLGLSGSGSESFLMVPDGFTPQVVPLPGALLLGMLGLGVAGLKLRKFA